VNLIKTSLNRGLCSDSEDVRLLKLLSYHDVPLFVRVSLGGV
jgi:hypothetical protein